MGVGAAARLRVENPKMDKRFLLALATVLVAASPTFAHQPGGTKNYCEDYDERVVHDYGPPATGLAVFLRQDGNLLSDCDGDTVLADFDEHSEFALGGAWLSVDSGDGNTGGSVICLGESGHHPRFGPISVEDMVLGVSTPFVVTADRENLHPPPPGEPDCGDFEVKARQECTGACTVSFPPGLDGTYVVYVGDARTGNPGTAGHIVS